MRAPLSLWFGNGTGRNTDLNETRTKQGDVNKVLLIVITQKQEEESVSSWFCSEVRFGARHKSPLEVDWEDDCVCLLLAYFSFPICSKYPVPAGPNLVQQENTC